MSIYTLLKNKNSILYDEDINLILIPLLLMLDLILIPLQPIMYFIIKHINKVNEEKNYSERAKIIKTRLNIHLPSKEIEKILKEGK